MICGSRVRVSVRAARQLCVKDRFVSLDYALHGGLIQEVIGIERSPIPSRDVVHGRLVQVLIRLELSRPIILVVRMEIHVFIGLVVEVCDLIIDTTVIIDGTSDGEDWLRRLLRSHVLSW